MRHTFTDTEVLHSGRSSDFRLNLLKSAFPTLINRISGIIALFVPGYSDGLAPDFHGIPLLCGINTISNNV